MRAILALLSACRSAATLVAAVAAVAVAALLTAAAPAVAGQTCEPLVPTPGSVARGLELGREAYDRLDATGAEVALIARAGQDLTRYGLRYSHMGFVWRDHPEGRWTVVHELNRCGSAESMLFDEGLGNFFLDDPFRYEALIVVPDAATQRRIATMLAGGLPEAMHERHYSVVAYPFATQYQNSNQWVLELLAAALSRDFVVGDRAAAQAWLRGTGYRPTVLDIPAGERLGARMFKANVAFDDHPFERRMSGRIDAVTVESVVDFLRARGVVAQSQTVTLAPDLRRRIAGDG